MHQSSFIVIFFPKNTCIQVDFHLKIPAKSDRVNAFKRVLIRDNADTQALLLKIVENVATNSKKITQKILKTTSL
jgi:hypothetical protein